MKLRLLLLILIIALPVGLQLSGVVDFFDLDFLKQNEAALKDYKKEHPMAVLGMFVVVYTVVCALPIPAVAMLTVAAGMLFGFTNGLFVVSFSSAVGATLAFWLARFLGQELLHRAMGKNIAGVDRELNDAGFAYATSLRLIPGVPFFVVNTALGLTTMRTATFYVSTQIGMLLMLGILVNAGDKLSGIGSLDDVLSGNVVISLALLALVPLSLRLISRRLKLNL
jgi:uncharacterized membrane protein YdjX (TVP38/TMEM64 family)